MIVNKKKLKLQGLIVFYFIFITAIWIIFVILISILSGCFIIWFTNYYETTLQSVRHQFYSNSFHMIYIYIYITEFSASKQY